MISSAFALAYSKHVLEVRRLYRQALKTVQDYSLDFTEMRRECLKVRQHFDNAKSLSNPKHIEAFKMQMIEQLTLKQHPQPYYYPTSPRGTKYDRDPPVPQRIIDEGQILVDEYNEKYVKYEKIK